ncbi:FAD-binding domain-containing protein [Phialemonium atrogriseum]|uniref:FAD-binding domain-containing protein n=1 Tax=Phialemonium atrogriseum TaxID=1093897 RepID=A0AAJ0FJV2_9PEZI|nr:FAD-binding domain-containing protein [Phialemonium atrogriseum]KAK1763470.1 FAD-binding domain-containing protein [Phialemonium atrogriseum]
MGNSGSSLQTCLNAVCNGRSGCVGYPSDPLYQISWVKPYNLDIPVTPVAVIRPNTAKDVAGIVKCAAANDVKVQAKSGGHSYGYLTMDVITGVGGTNGEIAIDMVNFQGFSMNETTWQATIGSGTRLGDVTKRLHGAGGRAIAHGVCPGVGIGGHATIGGLGPMSRMWGSCLDHVVGVEVVTADGSIRRASSTENSDLFWALKGAGAGFGIITEFVVRTHPEPGSVVQFTYTITVGSQADIVPSFKAWQDLVVDPDLDRRFGTEFIMEPLGCIITGTFYGTQAEFNATGIPAKLPKGGKLGLTINNWVASLVQDAENEALYLTDTPTAFYSKSLAFRPEDAIPEAQIRDLFKWIDGATKGTLLWFVIFDATGGAVNDVAANATAYPHRDKFMFYQSYAVGFPPLPRATRDFLAGVHSRILAALPVGADAAPHTTYAGYVDPALTDGPQEYWGSNLPQLELVKRTWDAADLFSNPQSVRPASAA